MTDLLGNLVLASVIIHLEGRLIAVVKGKKIRFVVRSRRSCSCLTTSEARNYVPEILAVHVEIKFNVERLVIMSSVTLLLVSLLQRKVHDLLKILTYTFQISVNWSYVCTFFFFLLKIGQRHGGFLGILQRALARASPHIWFERSEVKDREAVAKRCVYLNIITLPCYIYIYTGFSFLNLFLLFAYYSLWKIESKSYERKCQGVSSSRWDTSNPKKQGFSQIILRTTQRRVTKLLSSINFKRTLRRSRISIQSSVIKK